MGERWAHNRENLGLNPGQGSSHDPSSYRSNKSSDLGGLLNGMTKCLNRTIKMSARVVQVRVVQLKKFVLTIGMGRMN